MAANHVLTRRAPASSDTRRSGGTDRSARVALVALAGLLLATLTSVIGPAPAAQATPGVANWRAVVGGSGNNDAVNHVTTDAVGNTYVMGLVQGNTTWGGQAMNPVGLWDVFVAKVDSAGTVQWVRTFGGSGGDSADGIAVDAAGNVYALMSFNNSMTIGGTTLVSAGIYDIALVKFDSAGTFTWVRKLGGQTSSDGESARGLATDAAGNVTVLGDFTGTFAVLGSTISTTGSNQDLFVARFTTAGNLTWLQRKGTATAYEYGDAITQFGTTTVITGHQGAGPVTIDGITRDPGSGAKGFVAWLSNGGTATAVAAFRGSSQLDPADVAVLPTGDAVVAGVFQNTLVTDTATLTGPSSTEQAFVVTATVGGSAVSGFTFSSPSNIRAQALDLDEAGNVAVNLRAEGTVNLGGIAYANSGGRDALVVLATPTGSVLWSTKVGSSGDEQIDALDVAPDGDIVLGGHLDGNATLVGQGYVLANPQGFVARVDDPVIETGADRYFPKTPTRVLDSRDGTGTALGPWTAGQTRVVKVAGTAGVPVGASAVVINVTGTGPSLGTHLTAFPAGQPRPTSSNVNLAAGETAANLVTVKVGTNGNIAIFNNSGTVHVIGDVVGWYETNAAGTKFTGVTPKRLVDTRDGTGGSAVKLGPGATRNYTLAGVAGSGVPADAKAVVVNITATDVTDTTHITAWPAGQVKPDASSLNVGAGITRPNLAIIGLSPAGQASFFNNMGSVHLIVDVVGYFHATNGSQFTPVVPARVLDSRNGLGGFTSPWGTAQTRTAKIGGTGGAPAGASAVVLNVTVTGPTQPSHLTVWPAGLGMPVASNLNFSAGQTIPNQVIVKLGSGGALNVFNNAGSADVIIDVVGWYA